jgi:rfaE bifunctional protein kinase chain/domain
MKNIPFDNLLNGKLLSLKSIKNLVGKFPRKKKVVLCHGVFDVIHPGHLRHFSYVKKKADILVVSITEDQFVGKGHYKPHIPSHLRALTLCALEIVDYVLINKTATALNVINSLKPDFFAKGYEYSDKKNFNTTEEDRLVNSYGGKFLFTPGDLIYSSTNIQKNKDINIDIEKIIFYMKYKNINFIDIKNILLKKSKINIHVVGDTIVDKYIVTNLIGGQIKTPTISVSYLSENSFLGGAAIVASHLKSAGATVTFTTVLGKDKIKNFVIKELKKQNIRVNPLILNYRPTTEKCAIIANNYRLLKIDNLDNQPISNSDVMKICKIIKKVNTECIIFSDFRHGIFHKESIKNFIDFIPKNILRVADSQVASRWGNILDYINFDIITPNEKEARFSLADQDSNVSNLARNLLKETKCKNIFLKLGSRGVCSIDSSLKKEESFSLPSFTENPIDPVGAGDAMLAYLTISFLKSKSHFISLFIGLAAAACACETNGNTPVGIKQVLKKIDEIEEKVNKFL